ncbi:hypothetical protein TTHERM_000537308 (macronuclear) [Tetrahymena thermophila SB210]|uniref:Uncharacterized protein n=1 Tax=Tetrahymena thermophila (strain SB210) TaxID=312017 RepID=W7WZA3_TETTS|nr:hypothetical protein TTHERM_000537308 [Tetrahymena thermophila SB210]EWS72220.1 hypothetical protein TTHERM_000537308 [Tetrahymena thermophila SB210]|eukprot:XP_012655263.1 hypothetical protein TTHERM_000537308 [Tetrahymena thermophila SB210]
MDIKGNDEMIIEEKSIDIPNQKKQKDMNKMLFQLLIQQKDECRISCDFSDVEFLKGLLQNFPKSQKVTLSLSNVGITEKEIQVLKNIFQIISSNTKEFNLNISRNSLFNKEAMALFQKLKKAKIVKVQKIKES